MNVNKHVKVLEQLRADGFGFDFGYELDDEHYAALDASIAALKALGAQKVVSWARLVYARPANAPDPSEGWERGEVVDVEFHNRPERPEGEGWYPLVVADTGDGTAPFPRINVKCETVNDGITGSAFLKVIRVEQEDDGSLTAVIDHWPHP